VKIGLRGTIGAALGTSAVEVEVPGRGIPLSELLESLAGAHPRARAYLAPAGGGGSAVLRVIHNGSVVPPAEDPVIRPDDDVLLMHAVAGGS
jgi:molybdopterin converting factor small subunit